MKGTRKIFDQRLEAAGRHFDRLRIEISKDELHDFRVSIKKLKALIRLWNAGQDIKHHLAPGGRMKALYQRCGQIRNLQLHGQRITEVARGHQFPLPATYLLALDMQILSSMNELRAALDKFSFHSFREKFLDHIDAGSYMDTRQYVLQQKVVLLTLLIQTAITDDTLHELRRMLKEIGYNHDLLGPELFALLPGVLKDPESIAQLTEKLGHFQDLCISTGLLQPSFLEQLERPEKETLLTIRNILSYEKEKRRAELLELLHQGIKAHLQQDRHGLLQ